MPGTTRRLIQLLSGLEADISFLGLEDDQRIHFEVFQDDGPPFNEFRGSGSVRSEAGIEWLATLRGRVGIPFDRLLIYATGGVAFADLALDLSGTFTPTGDQLFQFRGGGNDGILVGIAAGGGAEFMVTPNIIVRGEYLYIDLPERSASLQFGWDQNPGGPPPFRTFTFDRETDPNLHIARVGVSWKFN